MNFLVYEMGPIRDLRGTDREWVQQLREKLEAEPAVPGSPYVPFFEALGGRYFKKRLDKLRLLAYRKDAPTRFGLIPVVVFLELFQRNDPKYENGKAEKLAPRFDPMLRAWEHNICRFAEEHVAFSRERPSPTLPMIPESLRTLLEPLPAEERGTAIFQSALWNEEFLRASPIGQTRLYEALLEIQSLDNRLGELSIHHTEDVEVYYVTVPDFLNNSYHYYLLGFIQRSWPESEQHAARQKLKADWERFEEEVLLPLLLESSDSGGQDALARQFKDAVSRFSCCAYPAYLLADADLWLKLTKTDSALLPLSSEELDVLERLLAGERFPALIEGRAGSGKTTLLSYYVPKRIIHSTAIASDQEKSFTLLYLAESSRLLENASETIEILKQKLQQMYSLPPSQFDVEFKTFRDFALTQLPVDRRVRFWDITKQIDFTRFRSLLRHPKHGLHAKLSRDLQNPEILWFVIRSYIKGFNLNEEGDNRWMGVDQFADEEELGQKDRQVSVEVYGEIWKKVWPWYKRLTVPCSDNEGSPHYWDALDLAWEVLLHRDPAAPSYAILVCDEVQDLTRVEMAAIFQSSEFLKYSRDPAEAGRVPIILAGDSYQTINPSCFRWARLKTDCAKALIQQIPNASVPRIVPFELMYNYRNRPSIAQLCNAIQMLRQDLLGSAGELQRLWRPEEQPLNQSVRCLIHRKDGIILKQLFLSGVSFLGPEAPDVHDDTSAQFWSALGLPDGPPRVAFREAEDGRAANVAGKEPHDLGRVLNYECPADLKGLEKPFVVLLGFGTAFAQLGLGNIWEEHRYLDELGLPESRLLSLEYFLNRLYVATSRAREQLWIVETEEGWNAFWKPLETWIATRRRAEGTVDTPYGFVFSPGDPEELIGVARREWPRLAAEYERLTEERLSPELAERAAYFYRLAGDSVGEQRCLAFKLYFEGRLEQAVETILPIAREKALTWAWESKGWHILVKSDFHPSWQNQVAREMLIPLEERSRGWVSRLAALLTQHSQKIASDLSKQRQSWQAWSAVITELVESAARASVNDELLRLVLEIGRQWSDVPHVDMLRFYKALAELHYRLNYLEDAVRLWEKARYTEHRNYFLSKARITPYPGNLQYLESAGEWDVILREAESNPSISVSVQDSRRVLRACREKCRWRQAVEIACRLENRDFAEMWQQIANDSSVETGNLNEYIEVAWRVVSRMAEGGPEEVTRQWSFLILDALLKLTEATTNEQSTLAKERVRDRIYGPLIHGLSIACEPQRLAGHFQKIWEEQEDHPDRWDHHKHLLNSLVEVGCVYVKRSWEMQDYNKAAILSHLLCNLLWDSSERIEDKVLRGWFDRVYPREYVRMSNEADPGGSPNQDQAPARGSDVFVEMIRPEFRRAAWNAIGAVAEAPHNAIRNLPADTWANLRNLVEGMAYAFLCKVGPVVESLTSAINTEDETHLMQVGRFCRQANFRKLAVQYYSQLNDHCKKPGCFSDNFRKHVESELQAAKEDQAEIREYRPESPDEVLVRRGKSDKSRRAEVRSLPDRPLVVMELDPPQSYQVRFSVDEERGTVHLSAVEEVTVKGPRETGLPSEWQLKTPEGVEYRLTWIKNEDKLRIEAPDKVFVVELAARHM